LFGVPGSWDLLGCTADDCGLLWLGGLPDEQEVGRFYERYYTHVSRGPTPDAVPAGLKRFWYAGKRGRAIDEARRFYLDGPPGRVLEVGCGAGDNLARLRAMGFEVHGQEIDGEAARIAREHHRLDVYVGPIDAAPFPRQDFDIIIMNHVVEHLREPARDLAASLRLLRPGGRLVCVTPNADSLSHRMLGRRWRGLEPPRHLFVYNPSTLRRRLTDAGFRSVDVFTRSIFTDRITIATVELALRGAPPRVARVTSRVAGGVAQVTASTLRVDRSMRGDECVAVAMA
jgi:SAM-dependent methyltransferase